MYYISTSAHLIINSLLIRQTQSINFEKYPKYLLRTKPQCLMDWLIFVSLSSPQNTPKAKPAPIAAPTKISNG